MRNSTTLVHASLDSPELTAAPLAPGDLLFYTADGSLANRLISWRTGGPYVHISIVTSASTVVEAVTPGVRHGSIERMRTDDAPRLRLARTSIQLDPTLLPDALIWLNTQVGQPYNWWDIANFALRLLWTTGPILTGGRGFDCSDLTLRFLDRAGYALPPAMREEPALASPNSIASLLLAQGMPLLPLRTLV